MRDAFISELSELAAADPSIMLITGDLGFGVLDSYIDKFPDQFINAGVAEQNMTGVAAGLALSGRTVFTYSIGNFPTLRCLEQIRNDAAYHNANVNVVAIGGGFSYGALGMSHHATEDLAIMRALPEVTVVSPGCEWEVRQATQAIAETPGTSYLRLDKSKADITSSVSANFRLGHARKLRDGLDLSIVTTGGILGKVQLAVNALVERGVDCELLNVHTIKPFDAASVTSSVAKTGHLLVVEEHVREGGLGGAVAEALLDAGVAPKRSIRIGLAGGYSTIVGSQDFLRRHHGMNSDSIESAVLDLVGVRL